MKKLFVSVLLLTSLNAEVFFEPFFAAGNSKKSFSWSVGDSAGRVSKLEWKDIDATVQDLGLVINHPKIEASLVISRGKASSGTATDSDYNPTLYKQSVSNAKGSTFNSEMVSIGTKIGTIKKIELGLFGAYISSSDKYLLKDGKEVVPTTKPIVGLDSSYTAKTNGFGGVARAKYSPFEQYGNISFGYGRFVLDYKATGDWNLRPDIQSFSHRGTATKDSYWAELEINLPKELLLFAKWQSDSYEVSSGEDIIVHSDYSISRENLQSVSFEDQSIKLGIKGRF